MARGGGIPGRPYLCKKRFSISPYTVRIGCLQLLPSATIVEGDLGNMTTITCIYMISINEYIL